MATIKEMAEKAYPIHDDIWMHNAYIAGANAVLEEIIECMPKTHSFNPNESIDIIASRIKELRKEK